MHLKTVGRFGDYDRSTSFNITPIIDIVFLLIIFFLVVCQFIEAENFPVDVPDDCEYAASISEPDIRLTTVTVMKTADGGSGFAVGSERVGSSNYVDRIENIARLIDVRLRDLPSDRRIVTLRIDKDISFSQAQYALAGIAASSATGIQLAVLRDNRVNPQ
jgi:biopolymer transport protein ExbD